MRFRAVALRRVWAVAGLSALLALPAVAAQEPFGQDITGWRFTQDIDRGSVLCRAFSPGPTRGVIVQRRGNGQYYMSIVARVPRGRYEGASFEVGRSAEPVNATADGARVYLAVDDQQVAMAVRAGGFHWAVNGRRQTGQVQFNYGFAAAMERLRQCTRANGGR